MRFLRKATFQDIDLIYEWANDGLVRANSFKSEQIPYSDHVEWYNRMMTDDTVLQYIMMEDDIPVGQIRLVIEGDSAEVNYSIASKFRGKGYGHVILQLAQDLLRDNNPNIRIMIAKVKSDNVPSKKLFEEEGYDLQYLCYSKNIE